MYTVNNGQRIPVRNEIAQTLVNKLAASIISITAPLRDAVKIAVPPPPSGFSIAIYKTNHPCIDLDGNITQPLIDTSGTIILICTHLPSGKVAYTIPLPVTVLSMTQVTKITVSPSTTSIGLPAVTAQQFTATVTTIGSPNTAVVWSVSGQTSVNTKISTTGLLTVGSDETVPNTIVITATSVFDVTKYSNAKADILEQIDYGYTGAVQSFLLQPGTYIIECWGAQGNNATKGGKGGYTKGKITLTTAQTIYAYIGSQPSNRLGGWNGGGATCGSDNTGGGGGATDIRLTNGPWDNITSLRSRIMVAAGGGGHGSIGATYNGGAGGGLSGGNGIGDDVGFGSTQIAGGGWTSGTYGGHAGSFGRGGYHGNSGTADNPSGPHDSNGGCGGGGSGYYGGGSGAGLNNNGAGGGGSSFISGYAGCNAIKSATDGSHTGQPNHYSGIIFTETVMQAGNNTGNGRMKITKVA